VTRDVDLLIVARRALGTGDASAELRPGLALSIATLVDDAAGRFAE
jgi:hypothetical protein